MLTHPVDRVSISSPSLGCLEKELLNFNWGTNYRLLENCIESRPALVNGTLFKLISQEGCDKEKEQLQWLLNVSPSRHKSWLIFSESCLWEKKMVARLLKQNKKKDIESRHVGVKIGNSLNSFSEAIKINAMSVGVALCDTDHCLAHVLKHC